ncbi:MAG TPA: L,D-transpeptidase [Acidobacteriota bacterium]|nr:L,D-transpeptidase [Acidobacteriota bacterium]
MPAASGKVLIFVSTLVLIICVLAGIWFFRATSVIPTRPWLLEANLQSSLAGYRAVPADYALDGLVDLFETRLTAAKQCIDETDRVWAPFRDYTGCVSFLMQAKMASRLLDFDIYLRQSSEKKVYAHLMASLLNELEPDNRNRRIWSTFNLQDINETRAHSLTRQAQTLAAEGRYRSAITAVLGAMGSLREFNRNSDRLFARFYDTRLRRQWNQQAEDLVAWSRKTGKRALLVDKLEHLCLVIHNGKIERSFSVNLGQNWHQRKSREHDMATPEGAYLVTRMNPRGRFGHSLLLDYPTATDRERFRTLVKNGDLPPKSRIGGNIAIHGAGRPSENWTEGCVALIDADMRQLYRIAYPGMPVTIVGASRLASQAKER